MAIPRDILMPNAKEPHPAFRFVVTVNNQRVGAFLKIKLPKLQWKTQEVKEGGLNTYTHELILQRKKAKLTLERGVGITADLLDWYMDALNGTVTRKAVSVTLLDSEGKNVVIWSIEGAFPIQWQGPKLDTKAKAIAIEKLTLSCGRISVMKGEDYQ